MLQVARLAPNLLGEAAGRLAGFLAEELNPDGGARDREGKSDLYYTAFLLDGLIALGEEPPRERVAGYLEGFGGGEALDLVHKACLARCHVALGRSALPFADALAGEVERYRSGDGGYAGEPGRATGTLYHAFLALGVYQDLGRALPEPEALGASLSGLRTADGGYANALDLPVGTTPSTAAACAVLAQLERPVPPDVGDWLLAQQHAGGGFKAMPVAPIPDLLSTATALHALGTLGRTLGEGRDLTLDFLDSLWTGRGFTGNWEDDQVDCEYAFYALLALGHLSLAG